MTDIEGISRNQELLDMPALRRFPSLAEFSKQSKRSFVDIMEQFMDSDPGITIEGKYYSDQGSTEALMVINNYLSDNQNITASYTKLSDAEREMERQVEKLVG